MKRNRLIGVLTALFIVGSSLSAIAEKVPTSYLKRKNNGIPNKGIAEGCLPASASTELNINNVRCRINSGGDMWWDLADVSEYEIPQGSRKTSMFAGALWIGGTDVNGQLKLAAQRYRQVGYDYWTGPLTTDGTAAISSETCVTWDKLHVVYRKDVDDFLAWRAAPGDFPDYSIPRSITDYPAHGDESMKQSFYLAPFYDVDEDGVYDYTVGDYPYYDLDNDLCHKDVPTKETELGLVKGGLLADQVLKGDQTIWWVFNDRGNVHTETGGASIGLEIRAQAFAFATNDEVNNMTFYSFEIINRSTYRLQETYMSLWTDPDLGYAKDDYVGCDVLRGLGYCYNGTSVDGTGAYDHYGDQPPAVGIDFFQGPYMDKDGLDNPKYTTYVDPITLDTVTTIVCDESVNGVNFGNDIVDDERYGMRRFVYHNNSGTVAEYMTDPDIAVEYYNFLRGFWKDNTRMLYGGNAHVSSGAYGPECDFMFPDLTDPCDWGTGGIPPNGPKKWTEETAGNQEYDRRFMQSAGPFTLEPGAVNYITVGLPWARATTGGAFASVELLRKVDDKCQRLFDNCFKVVDGPDAPDLVMQELDKELILYISNKMTSNNFNELYQEHDPAIVSPDSVPAAERYDSLYRFEGYQIYQVKDETVTASEVHDADLARIVAQCDVKNGVSRLINFYYNEDLGALVPQEEVNGGDEGIVHSFRIVEDQFATGDRRLVNNKKYYFIVVAYGYNEYEKYSQDPANQIEGIISLYGQQKPYLAGRKNIKVYTGIPHIPSPEAMGTVANAEYGDGPKITRLEGQGNGGLIIDLTQESINEIVEQGFMFNPTYTNGNGPISVKVIDPLSVKNAQYILRFDPLSKIDSANWVLEEYDLSGNLVQKYNSDKNIAFTNEQIFVDLGISVTISQCGLPADNVHATNGFLNGSLVYADSSHRWLSGIPDIDGNTPYNWIRSGTVKTEGDPTFDDYNSASWIDASQYYEKILGGTVAPYRLCATASIGTNAIYNNPVGPAWSNSSYILMNKMSNLASVKLVFTPDKSKWTRCPVLEAGNDVTLTEGGASQMGLRKHASVDKDGQSGTAEATYDGHATGMGWFPGYAINMETGERLNVMFAENSWLAGENGADMILNPTSNYEALYQYLWGGMHFVYVMGHNGDTPNDCPIYDEGSWLYTKILSGTQTDYRYVFEDAMWVTIPMLAPGEVWLQNEAVITLNVTKPYKKDYSTVGSTTPENDNFPMYGFNTADIATVKGDLVTAKSALDLINVVPNPYYAFSGYETNQLDNRVKFTNLPDKCTISIYTIDGTLIRRYTKDDPTTYIDWDLKNSAGIPISGGLYLIHVNAPGIGERTIKWFGSLRPIDLNSF